MGAWSIILVVYKYLQTGITHTHTEHLKFSTTDIGILFILSFINLFIQLLIKWCEILPEIVYWLESSTGFPTSNVKDHENVGIGGEFYTNWAYS